MVTGIQEVLVVIAVPRSFGFIPVCLMNEELLMLYDMFMCQLQPPKCIVYIKHIQALHRWINTMTHVYVCFSMEICH